MTKIVYKQLFWDIILQPLFIEKKLLFPKNECNGSFAPYHKTNRDKSQYRFLYKVIYFPFNFFSSIIWGLENDAFEDKYGLVPLRAGGWPIQFLYELSYYAGRFPLLIFCLRMQSIKEKSNFKYVKSTQEIYKRYNDATKYRSIRRWREISLEPKNSK